MPEPLTIAQVTPYPWEDEHEVNAFVRALAAEQAASGHRVAVLAPTRDPALVRESRRLIRGGELYDPDGGVRVLGVGELLPLAGARRGTMPAELGESQTSSLASRFSGTPPNASPSMRMWAHLRSVSHGT